MKNAIGFLICLSIVLFVLLVPGVQQTSQTDYIELETNSSSSRLPIATYLGSTTATGTTATITINKPTSAISGTLMLAYITYLKADKGIISPPINWTLLLRADRGADVGCSIYSKFTETEPSSYTWTYPENTHWVGAIVVYSDVNRTHPFESYASAIGDSSSQTAPSTSVYNANTRVLVHYSNKPQSSYTPHATTTERYDMTRSGGPAAMLADFVQATVGSTPTKTATATVSEKWVATTIVLRSRTESITISGSHVQNFPGNYTFIASAYSGSYLINVNVTINSMTYPMTKISGLYYYTTTLPFGTHTYSFNATDGNFSHETSIATLYYNNTAPTIGTVFHSPTTGNNGTTFTFVASVTDYESATVSTSLHINNTTYSMTHSGGNLYRYDLILPTGNYSYYVEANDTLLNTSSSTYYVNVTEVVPEGIHVSGVHIRNFAGNYTFVAGATGPINPISINLTINSTTYPMIKSNGLYYFTKTLLFGYYTYSFNATDGTNFNITGTSSFYVNDTAPVFDYMAVYPSTGNNATTFEFIAVVYHTDISLLNVTLHINSQIYTMTHVHGDVYLLNLSLPAANHPYYLVATDAISTTTSSVQYLNVTSIINYPPMLVGTTVISHPNLKQTFLVSAYDFELDPITMQLIINGSTHLMIPISGNLYLYNITLERGTYPYQINATDGYTYSIILSDTLNVTNTAPALSYPTIHQNGNIVTFQVMGSDIDGDPLNTTLFLNNVSYSMNSSGSLYSLNLPLTYGTYVFRFNATDGIDYAPELSGVIEINATVYNLSISSHVVFPSSGFPTTAFTFIANVYDPLQTSVFAFLVINNNTYAMFQTENQYVYSLYLPVGTHDYYFSATDGVRFTSKYGGQVVVNPILNCLPVVSAPVILPAIGTPDTVFSFVISAYDSDGDPLLVKIKIDSNWYSVLSTSGLYIYQSSFEVGTHHYLFSVYDGKDTVLTSESSFEVIPRANRAPSIVSLTTPFDGSNRFAVSFSFEASDPEDDVLLKWVMIDEVTHDLPYSALLTPGMHSYLYVVSDGEFIVESLVYYIEIKASISLRQGLNSVCFSGESIMSNDLFSNEKILWVAIWSNGRFYGNFWYSNGTSFAINAGDGIFIFCSGETYLDMEVSDPVFTVDLTDGLNLVGNPSDEPITLSEFADMDTSILWVAVINTTGTYHYDVYYVDRPFVNANVEMSSYEVAWVFRRD